MSYRLSTNFVPVEWFLAELWPLKLYFLFKCLVVRTFFLPPMRYWPDIWYVAISRWGTMYSLSLKFVLVEWFLVDLWPLNLYFLFKCLVVRTFFYLLSDIDLIFGMLLYLDEFKFEFRSCRMIFGWFMALELVFFVEMFTCPDFFFTFYEILT